MEDKIIFDFCSDVIVILDSFGNVLRFNKKAELIFGIPTKNIIGLNFFEVMKKHEVILSFAFEDLNLIKANTPHFLEGDILIQRSAKNQNYNFSWTINRYANKSRKNTFILLGNDISETISYKNSLQNSQIYLKNIIENLPQYVYWKDRNLVYQGCNNLVAQYLGIKSPLEIIGKTDNDFNWDKNRVSFLSRIDELIIQEGTTDIIEDVIPKEDGSNRIMLSSKAPLRNEKNEIVGILGISFDITARKEMERELKKAKEKAEVASKAKSEFIANMSHDIRVPMTGVLGLIQELINLADDTSVILPQISSINSANNIEKYQLLLNQVIKKVREDGQLLIGATDELLQLLNEILETADLDSGKAADKAEAFNLHELVEHNLELNLPVAQHKKLKLTCEFEKGIPIYFNGIRQYLNRTLLNLLSNALKFTNEGFVKLKVELLDKQCTAYQLGDKVELKITVQDSGIGIPENKFDTIFEHFSRLTPSYQGIYKGSGLGLYTVKRYIEAMKATIKVESKVGKGTSFIITLPLIISDHSDREKIIYRLPKMKKAGLIKNLSPPKIEKAKEYTNADMIVKILIVEDNSIAARGAISIINGLYSHCVCDTASDGKQTIEMVKKNQYDLIFIDIGLADGEDGIGVSKQIRALGNSYAKEVPIVALTGHANTPEMKKEILAAGIQDAFTKPLTAAILEPLMQRYVFNHEKEVSHNAKPP